MPRPCPHPDVLRTSPANQKTLAVRQRSLSKAFKRHNARTSLTGTGHRLIEEIIKRTPTENRNKPQSMLYAPRQVQHQELGEQTASCGRNHGTTLAASVAARINIQ